MVKSKGKGGRPSKYRDDFPESARKLCEIFGATDNQLAEFLSVTQKTIDNWKEVYPEFFQSLKLGKDVADNKVEQSLYKRANGYMKLAEKFDRDGNPVMLQEELPPETTACIFWLKNRRPKEWRDRQEVDLQGTVNINILESK